MCVISAFATDCGIRRAVCRSTFLCKYGNVRVDGSGITIHQIQHVCKAEHRLRASVWCRLALPCGEQRQQLTLERRLYLKRHALTLLLHDGTTQHASQMCE